MGYMNLQPYNHTWDTDYDNLSTYISSFGQHYSSTPVPNLQNARNGSTFELKGSGKHL